jgi:uncharacterized membrane protein required for colicin V production
MLAKGTVGSYVALGCVGVVLLFALIGALKGFRNGLCRQLIRIIFFAISVVASFIITEKLGDFALGWLKGKTVGDITALFGLDINSLASPIPEILNALEPEVILDIVAIPLAVIVLLLAFLLLNCILNPILSLIGKLVAGALGFSKSKNNILTRIGGFALGLVQGVAIALITLLPITAVFNAYGDLVESIEEPSSDVDNLIISTYESYVADAEEGPIVDVIDLLGGEFIVSRLSTGEVGDLTKDMRTELPILYGVYSDVTKLSGVQLSALTPENKAAIRSITDRIGDDPFTASIVSGIIRSGATIIDDGVIPLEGMEEPFSTLIHSVIRMLKTTDRNTIKADMTTVENVCFIISDSGALGFITGDGGDITDLLVKKDENGNTVIDNVVNELNANPRTAHLVTELTQISISIMLGSNTLNAEAVEKYESIKTSSNSILAANNAEYDTPEEHKAAVSATLEETLKENDIELEPEVIDGMAEYVMNNEVFAGKEELTDEEFNELMLSYYSAYADKLGELE